MRRFFLNIVYINRKVSTCINWKVSHATARLYRVVFAIHFQNEIYEWKYHSWILL